MILNKNFVKVKVHTSLLPKDSSSVNMFHLSVSLYYILYLLLYKRHRSQKLQSERRSTIRCIGITRMATELSHGQRQKNKPNVIINLDVVWSCTKISLTIFWDTWNFLGEISGIVSELSKSSRIKTSPSLRDTLLALSGWGMFNSFTFQM